MGTVTRTIAVAGFPYKAKLGDRIVHKFATRGQAIELFDEGDIARGDNNGHFVKEGEAAPDAPPVLTLDEIGLMTDDQLNDLFAASKPAAKDLLAAVGDDATLAKRVLDAENSSGSIRVTLVKDLSKIIDAEAPAA